MIEVESLTKRYGETVAVDDLTFSVEPGQVTGFVGPNGSGKSTTMRAILGLDTPDAGSARIAGRPYAELTHPLCEVGALLDASGVHPGLRGVDHLRWLADSNALAPGRVPEVLTLVGLSGVGGRRIGTYSLGMRQRLGIAAALLGDPRVLLFDEPVHGLDPDGVRWIRDLMRSLAADGRTVLLSSHLMAEMALTADRLIIIGRGRMVADTSVKALAERFHQGVLVKSPRSGELSEALRSAGAAVTEEGAALSVTGLDVAAIGDLAAARGIPLHEVTPRSASLEDAYLHLTGGVR
jgi:ABC-2 type transport system ATP-binding protein